MASPKSITAAGHARIETVNENYTLEGATYFALAIPIGVKGEGTAPEVSPDWDSLSQRADDAARTVGLCLDQRTPLKKVAEYVKITRDDGTVAGERFRWPVRPGAKASVSKRSSESVRRALGSALDSHVSPQTLVALRWYDQSKAATNGADRLLALWIALEALMGPGTQGELVEHTARHLAQKVYRLGLSPSQVTEALGLKQMRDVRNKVVHRGYSPEPWPVSSDSQERDWPQILSDIVGEILRHHLNATLTRSMNRHIEDWKIIQAASD